MDCSILLGQLIDQDSFKELAPPIQIAIFLGALSFATAALVSLTAFTRIIIVLSFVRRALTTQEIPPNPVILGLSCFLTLFVMAPTLENINRDAVQPYLKAQKEGQGGFSIADAWQVAQKELKKFMSHNVREQDLSLFLELSGAKIASNPDQPPWVDAAESPLQVLVPAFIVSELKTAFVMGFCIYIPFLLIDLVVSTVLMSLGMMMMPPVIVSTPCKLLLFVLVDGWQLIASALVTSFGA